MQSCTTMNNLGRLHKSRLLLNQISSLPEMTFAAAKSVSTSNNAIRKFETLQITVPQPFVYHVELNRPNKRNAMSHTMWLEVKECFDSLSEDEDCRSIVLSGSGNMFCAGIDLQCFMDINKHFKETDDVARRAKVMYQMIKVYQNSLSSLEKCVKPVISAVHSACIGAGINMISSADIRYCTTDAWFQIKEIDLGMAADVGVIQRLPRIIGSASLTRELVFTGRKFPADEAKESGFINRVFNSKEELIEESIKIASDIASKSPVAVQTAKKSLIYSQDHTVEESLEHLALLNQTMLQSEDLMTAMMALATKSAEPPVFAKL